MRNKIRILFICQGNVYRSAVAEQLLRQFAQDAGRADRMEIFSRGLQGFNGTPKPRFTNLRYYDEEWKAVKGTLDELKISLEDHVATPISREDVAESDYIIAMSQDIYVVLLNAFPDNHSSIHSFGEFEGSVDGIPDPEGQTDSNKHRMTVLSIRAGTATIFKHLETWFENGH